jgi:UDP-N-acetylmuramate--alanine ligase
MDPIIKKILDSAKKIHFIGIGGVSISSLALLAKEMGISVSGSDRTKNSLCEKAEKEGIKVIYAHLPENVEGCDAVVYTAAVNGENPELKRAAELSIPCIPRADFLGYIMLGYENRIGISGTHGKTTTTSMISHIFIEAKMNPTVANGAVTEELGGTLGIGGRELFVYESCEYKDSFLSFFPTTSIITNIELDHTDYYPSLEAIMRSFGRSVECADRVIVNMDDKNAMAALDGYKKSIVTVSAENKEADFFASELSFERGRGVYDLIYKGEKLCKIRLSVIGVFNVYNSLCAFAAAYLSGASAEVCASALASFKPAKRRFEIKFEKDGITVADDYAHHPSEIAATLKGVKKIGEGRTVCIFQPHTYTRTHDLWSDFVDALSLADKVILADIYAARETDTLGVSSELMAKEIEGALYFDSFEAIANHVLSDIQRGDLILSMGAGDIFKVSDMIRDRLVDKT